MEDILDLLARPIDAYEPVVALDERPVPLRDDVRSTRRAKPGKSGMRDSEYRRKGVANVFAIIAPHEGRHLTHATPNRKAPRFAAALKRIARAYPHARTIHLIVDNLRSHSKNSLVNTFGESEGQALWNRFTVHYTPKHASWLNPAEMEISLWSRQCQGKQRIGSFAELRRRTAAWNRGANRSQLRITWKFRTKDARRTFGYRRNRRSIKMLSQH